MGIPSEGENPTLTDAREATQKMVQDKWREYSELANDGNHPDMREAMTDIQARFDCCGYDHPDDMPVALCNLTNSTAEDTFVEAALFSEQRVPDSDRRLSDAFGATHNESRWNTSGCRPAIIEWAGNRARASAYTLSATLFFEFLGVLTTLVVVFLHGRVAVSDRHLRRRAQQMAEDRFDELDLDDVDDMIIGVIRVQAWYRGHMGRIRTLRVLEYHSWADPRGGRPIVRALHTIIYGFTIVVILCALWINIIYGVKFPQEKANDWIISSVATLATDYVIVEITVCLFTVTFGEKLGKLYEAFNGG